MARETAVKLINESMYTLMQFTRKSRGPIEGFRARDLHVLKFIYLDKEEHRTTMSELAEHLNVTPAAASQIISSYEKNDWIKRVRSERDRRTVFVELTDKTKDILRKEWEEHQKHLKEFLDGLSDEDCESLVRIVDRIIDYFKELYK